MNFKMIRKSGLLFFVMLGLILANINTSNAQYFGQNKVRYKNLKFKVFQTPHFDFYHYLKNDSLVKSFAQEAEAWYELHQQVFRDTFKKPNPIILYNNHPDFQQTTVINGEIGVGTGGVTEGLKNRVIMPIVEINSQTRHILGHELVHAFQYHSLIEQDSTQLENIGNIPLWMVEGMAEYLSLGKVDEHTAMWMRDAVLNKDIPTLDDLTNNNKYFPYRYGQAFWAFIGSTYGDNVIYPFFRATAKFGYQMAIRRTFGFDEKALSTLWKNSIINTYQPLLKDTAQVPIGKKIVDNVNGGDMNVAPAVSPNGKYLAFLSEKELFTVDLYLADAQTGKIIRKLTSKIANTHIDEFNYIESAGAWSPDSRKFAFSVFSNGKNKMVVVDVNSGRSLQEVDMGEAEEFGNLTWSPDGKSIAFTGLSNGYADLYMYNFTTKKIEQLTDDLYTDYQPSFSSDGKKLVFSTDRVNYKEAKLNVEIPLNMAVIDIATKKIENLDIFPGANIFNAQFSKDDSQIYFLSNRDGFRNLYRYNLNASKVEQLTDYFTGISGITEASPALSISKNDDIVYSYYRAQKYTLYNAKASDFKPVEVEAQAVNFDAANLPPFKSVGVNIINKNLDNFLAYNTLTADSIKAVGYKPQFKLDYIASSGVGASVGRFGSGLSSGVQAIFSDILSRNQIFAGAAVNGEIYDFGGQFAYINQQGRWNIGGSVSHLPYQYGTYNFVPSQLNIENQTIDVFEEQYDIIRTFEDSFQAFTAYPFSKITRFELGAGASRYSYRVDRFSTYYQRITDTASGNSFIGAAFDQQRNKISRSQYQDETGIDLAPFTIYQINAAFVGDNSYNGIASPLNGFRYRLGIEQYFGDFNFVAPTVDLRKYVRIRPVTFAGRLYGYGRIGETGRQLFPLYIGYPFLIRGYDVNSFYNAQNVITNNFNIDQLQGNRIAVANFEVRLPFTGPEKLSAIKSKFLFSELNLFFDAGLAWNGGDKIAFKKNPSQIATASNGQPIYERVPATSVGLSARVNVFGYFVIEPYAAIPFNRTDVTKPVFGLTFAPGW